MCAFVLHNYYYVLLITDFTFINLGYVFKIRYISNSVARFALNTPPTIFLSSL